MNDGPLHRAGKKIVNFSEANSETRAAAILVAWWQMACEMTDAQLREIKPIPIGYAGAPGPAALVCGAEIERRASLERT